MYFLPVWLFRRFFFCSFDNLPGLNCPLMVQFRLKYHPLYLFCYITKVFATLFSKKLFSGEIAMVTQKKTVSVKSKTNKKVQNENLEVRQFKMHPDLLYSVIKSQAGTHEKALLEAVMNAVDAGASQCTITLDENGYQIVDDGKGFASRQEIEEFFETFGTPHKEGDATYGKFRMGRGQLFAFSRTIWRSNTFSMDVCIKTRGLNYHLEDNLEQVKGCQIQGIWHEKLKGSEILNLTKELKTLVRFMQIPVIFNDERISLVISEQKWDQETDDAYIKLSDNGGKLSVYNMGALVKHYHAYQFGTGGIIVSKTPLAVNFARNDILINECKVWKRIAAKMNEHMGIQMKKKPTLNNEERIAMVNGLLEGQYQLSTILTKGVLQDISGRKPTLKTLLACERLSVSSDWKHRKIEEKINDKGMSLVLDKCVLERFMVNSLEEFVSKIQSLIKENNLAYEAQWKNGKYYKNDSGVSNIYQSFNPTIIPIESLHDSFNDVYIVKDAKELNKKEKALLRAVRQINDNVCHMLNYHFYRFKIEDEITGEIKKLNTRVIEVGESDVAKGWTDGQSLIVLNTKDLCEANAHHLLFLLVHEYCHYDSSHQTHAHSQDFMTLFHNLMLYEYSNFSSICSSLQRHIIKELVKMGIKPTRVAEDRLEITEHHAEMVEGLNMEMA
jgi:hypothetical protein